MRRVWPLALVVALVLIPLTLAPTATGTSTGGCPTGDSWHLVTIQSLGFNPDTAKGIPSLDGNGDQLTCVQYLTNFPPSLIPNAFIFRDNTVQG
jgi:hypothetical protein